MAQKQITREELTQFPRARRARLSRAKTNLARELGRRAQRGTPMTQQSYGSHPRITMRPFETELRFPAQPFRYRSELTIATGTTTNQTVLQQAAPTRMRGVLWGFTLEAITDAWIAIYGFNRNGNGAIDVTIGGSSVLSPTVQDSNPLPQTSLIAQPGVEVPLFARVPMNSTIRVTVRRSTSGGGAEDYTYTATIFGWWFPIRGSR